MPRRRKTPKPEGVILPTPKLVKVRAKQMDGPGAVGPDATAVDPDSPAAPLLDSPGTHDTRDTHHTHAPKTKEEWRRLGFQNRFASATDHRRRAAGLKSRPAWWSAENVLSRLQEGQYIGNICLEASEEMAAEGKSVAPSTFRRDVSEWSGSASMGEAFTKALAICRYDVNVGRVVYSSSWHEEFLTALAANGGDMHRAAEAAEINPGIPLSKIDKRNACYDPVFHEQVRILEAEKISGIRKQFFDAAESGDTRVQAKILETHAPTQHAPRQEVSVSGEIDHNHQHTHGISADLLKEIAAASGARVRRIDTTHMAGGGRRLDGQPWGASVEPRMLTAGPVAVEMDHRGGTVIDVTPSPVSKSKPN